MPAAPKKSPARPAGRTATARPPVQVRRIIVSSGQDDSEFDLPELPGLDACGHDGGWDHE